ncbi:helix-turn-helix domain-containing protein [Paenibacillus silvae]|uniref:helix-turn-helix domain-containing protein n=1 Tax=Paenibacillus silvae TaxID=1325358 RepID=UPI00200666DC|nr:helix-turn-helix transcriptional regulator [Paenibacillus silvae]MCK6078372.1 helix-turn-helix domain-containing protein [Paenibacillus silvae]MCK6152605.1 helix-turn-helix domain-containing protein [Paenibacillus silvae]MCK6271217.1 helix-turn-helix domain-containing protein [Paenibacillus silvae]
MDFKDTGNRIQELRKSKFHNRNHFAQALQTSDENIKRIESGRGLPSIDLLIKMSLTLEVSTDYILFGTTTDPDDEASSTLIRLQRQLSPAGKKALHNIATEIYILEKG